MEWLSVLHWLNDGADILQVLRLQNVLDKGVLETPDACRKVMTVIADLIVNVGSLQHVDAGPINFAMSRDTARAVVAAVPEDDHLR